MARLVFLFKDANATCSSNINTTPDLNAKVREFVTRTKVLYRIIVYFGTVAPRERGAGEVLP